MIPQSNPKASYLAHKEEIDLAIKSVLESGWYILGQEVEAFEKEFSCYIGTDHTIGVASGTDALVLALRTLGIGSGDTVITVSHTAVATVAAIEMTGATPVLVDIDPVSFAMSPERLEEAIRWLRSHQNQDGQGYLKAVIPVHLYGHPADMPAIMEIAGRYELFVIEDCAQAHGAKLNGKKVGTWGDLGAFSFYPTKNLGALGDGGAIVTKEAELAKKARVLREYGWRERYISDLPGMNTRLDELQAAVLRVKLRYLDEDNARRRHLASLYHQRLASTDLVLPTTLQGADHVYHQFVIRSAQRDALQAHLKVCGIGTGIHYPMPVHLQPAYKNRVIVHGTLTESERAAREILSLPLYPELSDEVVNTVIDEILNFQQEGKI